MARIKKRIEALENEMFPADVVDVDGFWNYLISIFASVPSKEGEVTFEEAERYFIYRTGFTKAEFAKQFKRSSN